MKSIPDLFEVIAANSDYAVRMGVADAVADFGEALQPIKRALARVAEVQTALAREALDLTEQEFQALPPERRYLLELVVQRELRWSQIVSEENSRLLVNGRLPPFYDRGPTHLWVIGPIDQLALVDLFDSATEARKAEPGDRHIWGIQIRD